MQPTLLMAGPDGPPPLGVHCLLVVGPWGRRRVAVPLLVVLVQLVVVVLGRGLGLFLAPAGGGAGRRGEHCRGLTSPAARELA
jgi:hypothetical protein